jgi:transcriptional regulator with XRE-family HTH domain
MRLNHAALRVIRERTGLTQTQVAADAEIDRANYVHMEAGRRPGTAPQIKALAEVLCVPVTALLGPEPAPADTLVEVTV